MDLVVKHQLFLDLQLQPTLQIRLASLHNCVSPCLIIILSPSLPLSLFLPCPPPLSVYILLVLLFLWKTLTHSPSPPLDFDAWVYTLKNIQVAGEHLFKQQCPEETVRDLSPAT